MTCQKLLLDGPSTDARALGLLLLLGLGILGAGIGLREPWPADEPRYALVGVQMADSGQWLIPMRASEPYPDKPPVFMWAVALGYRLVGSIRIAFLLPSLLAALGSLGLTFSLGRLLWGNAVAWRAGVLLLLTMQFALQARVGQIDALLTLFMTLGVYSLVRFLRDERWPWWALGWTAAGLGVITKGVGFLALLVLLPALWTRRTRLRHASWRAWALSMTGPLCFAAVIAAWALPMLIAVDASGDPALAAYRDNILFRQTVTRYADAWHHLKPWYYYFVNVIPVAWLPLSLLLPWLVGPWLRSVRAGDGRVLALLSFVVLLLVFFSLSPGKRGVYITPALPALALLAAPYAGDVLRSRWPRRLLMGVAASLTLTLAGVAATVALRPDLVSRQLKAEVALSCWPLALAAVAALGFVVAMRRAPLGALLGTTAVSWLTLGLVVLPALNDARTPAVVLRAAETTVPVSDEVLLVGWKEQFLLFSTRPLGLLPIKTPAQAQAEAAARWQAEKPGRWVMGPGRWLTGHFDTGHAKDLGWRHGERWLLFPPGSARATVPGDDPPVSIFRPLACNGRLGHGPGLSLAPRQDLESIRQTKGMNRVAEAAHAS